MRKRPFVHRLTVLTALLAVLALPAHAYSLQEAEAIGVLSGHAAMRPPGRTPPIGGAAVQSAPALSMAKAVSPETHVAYHSTVTYTIDLANSGLTDLTSVQVSDALPISTTFAYWVEQPAGASVAADQIGWTGTVTAGQSVRFTFAVTHTGDLGDCITNTATFSHTTQAGTAGATFTVEQVYTMYVPLALRLWAVPPGFAYGIQAHGEHKLPQIVSSVQDLGLGWVKQQVRWEQIEGTRDDYGWSGLDTIVDAYNEAGFNVLFSVTAAPGWARGGKPGDGPPDDYRTFSEFMSALTAHFRGRVRAYEIWNEPNVQREWEGARLSAADYVRLLAGAYQAVKAVDPGAAVVSGAPAPTGINDGILAIDDRVFLQQMYDAGLKDNCDAVGAHPYGFANPPDVYYAGGDFDPNRGWDDHPCFFFRNTMEDYYQIMAAHGDGEKRVWATEFGWSTVDGMGTHFPPSPGQEYARDINQQQQADYIVRAYTWSGNWGHAGVMVLWNLNYWSAAGPWSEMAKYSIVRGDWSPRPAYSALRDMAK